MSRRVSALRRDRQSTERLRWFGATSAMTPGGIVGCVDVTRAKTARKLASDLSAMAALAAALADEAVYELTRSAPAKEVAVALGVSEPAVRKAVQLHNKRKAAQ